MSFVSDVNCKHPLQTLYNILVTYFLYLGWFWTEFIVMSGLLSEMSDILDYLSNVIHLSENLYVYKNVFIET